MAGWVWLFLVCPRLLLCRLVLFLLLVCGCVFRVLFVCLVFCGVLWCCGGGRVVVGVGGARVVMLLGFGSGSGFVVLRVWGCRGCWIPSGWGAAWAVVSVVGDSLGGAAWVFEVSVDGFGGAVAGVGVFEVG